MKTLGIILVMGCCMAAGKTYSLLLLRRIRELERSALLIRQIELQLSFSQAPPAEIVLSLSGHPELTALRYLSDCAEKLRSGVPFPVAWREAVSQASGSSALNGEDIELLISFGSGLGTTDLSGQKKLCAMHAQLLEERLNAARRQYQSKGKLGTVLGTSAGAVAVLFFV